MSSKLVTTSALEGTAFEQLKKVFNLKTHCRDKCLEFIVKQYLVIMAQLNTQSNYLFQDLAFQAAFTQIYLNVTNVDATREEYVKTHAKVLKLSFQAGGED